ncbi:MAG: DUF1345 domain-containing protein [Pseudonocardia sp.]|nr:DUF1345 domain-containing protein [Pseudonocardia sp.]
MGASNSPDDASSTAGARPGPDAGGHLPAQLDRLQSVREELTRLEEVLCGGHHPLSGTASQLGRATARVHVPAWLRQTRGENRWPVVAVVLFAICLQLLLPDRLTLVSHWLLPGLELAVLIGLVVANPARLNRESAALRTASLVLTGVLSLANAWSAVLLAAELITGQAGEDAGPLLSTGAAIWLTNIVAFALWYWEFDRGGPAARANARRRVPDFQFPQMLDPQTHNDWEPGFVDYLYLSFTNATAFSPTDVMPLSRWAKLTMLGQSLVSLTTIALVIARAVNILK